MNILILEPYHGGSHKAFLDGWNKYGQHELTVLGLPAHKWKWRMRHSAITLADKVAELCSQGERWDAIFASDMLNMAEFRGLAPAAVADLPAVCYFHENQLTYPVRHEQERDLHFAMTNIVSALAAEAVWFNSEYHRDSFLGAVDEMLSRMPDYAPVDCVKRIKERSAIMPQGIVPLSVVDGASDLAGGQARAAGPLRILWNARWEHDKNPECFFDAMHILKNRGVSFELLVMGEAFSKVPEVFGHAREEFAGAITAWGFKESREEYIACLRKADVAVSTAMHEFFGVAVVEAVSAGAFPVVPRRLAYPEVLGGHDAFFHDGTAKGLADMLAKHAESIASKKTLWEDVNTLPDKIVSPYIWPNLGPRLDAAMSKLSAK